MMPITVSATAKINQDTIEDHLALDLLDDKYSRVILSMWLTKNGELA